jgi:lysyl-tRNA synthetase class I
MNINLKTSEETKRILKKVCYGLGINNLTDIESKIDKINMVVRLIPQMENFIRQINATVNAYELDTSTNTNNQTRKLDELLKIVRKWAENYTKDDKGFIKDIHELLYIQQDESSYKSCLLEIIKLIEPKKSDSQISKQCFEHFKNLFEVNDDMKVLMKMNDLFVFWAEVNDGIGVLSRAFENLC